MAWCRFKEQVFEASKTVYKTGLLLHSAKTTLGETPLRPKNNVIELNGRERCNGSPKGC